MASRGHEFKLRTGRLVEANTGDEVTLPCHLSPDISAVSMTIRWFKETECVYLYKNGQVIEGRGYEDRLSLVTQELERGNVSLTLRDFRESDEGVYICQVIHGDQEQEKAVGLWTWTSLARLLAEGLVPVSLRDRASRYLKKETAEEKLQRIRSAELLELGLSKKDPLKQLVEMAKKLTACEEKLKQKDATLNQRETELQEAESKLKISTLELNDLKTEVERLRKELSAPKTV